MMISDQWEGIGIHEAGLFGKRQPQKECQVKQRTWNYDLKIKQRVCNYDLQNYSSLVMIHDDFGSPWKGIGIYNAVYLVRDSNRGSKPEQTKVLKFGRS